MLRIKNLKEEIKEEINMWDFFLEKSGMLIKKLKRRRSLEK